MRFELRINGGRERVEAEAGTPLLWVLRDELGLTGAKYACGIGACGACTVHVDGRPVRACVLPVEQVGAAEVTTVEGLSPDGSHPVQVAWLEGDVPQCGYCHAGQIMAAAALLADSPRPSEEEIARAMEPILCRCGTYPRIRAAVLAAAGLPDARAAGEGS